MSGCFLTIRRSSKSILAFFFLKESIILLQTVFEKITLKKSGGFEAIVTFCQLCNAWQSRHLKGTFLNLSTNPFLFIYFLFHIFHIKNLKSKNLLAKIKNDCKRKLAKDIKIFHERYKNLSENQKNKLVEYRKKYYSMRKIT